MNFPKKLKEVLTTISSGEKIKDKIALIWYFLLWPLRRTFFKKLNLPWNVIIKNKDGIFVCEKDYSAVDCAQVFWEKSSRRVFLNLKEGIFIDVGANIGKYSIMVGNKIKGKVISIEPDKKNTKMIKESIKKNHLKNIILIEKACSSKKEKRRFYLDGEGVGRHSFYKTKLKNPKCSIELETETLDKIVYSKLKKDEIKDIKLIKIDVEGASVEVLEGGLKCINLTKPKILIEVWDEETLKKIKKILDPLGYSSKQINQEDFLFSYNSK